MFLATDLLPSCELAAAAATAAMATVSGGVESSCTESIARRKYNRMSTEH